MCYAIPGRVKGLDGKYAIVDYFGEEKKAVNELLDLQVGDYVYAQGGFVITKVKPPEAVATLETWKELFFELQSIDLRSISFSPWHATQFTRVRDLVNRGLEGGKLSEDEKKYLLEIQDDREQDYLWSAANFLRQRYHKNSCCVHGIIEISNHCRRNCYYCGISTWNKRLARYRMSQGEILTAARTAVEQHGFKALVLQSGEDAGYSLDELVAIVAEIKKELGVLIFISFGEIGSQGLERLYSAGARGILLRFETSNPQLYAKLHPGYHLEKRVAEIRKAFELGYLLVTGSLVGIPGQTTADILRDLELAAELKTEMLSVGPFLPHPQTPLAQGSRPSVTELMQVIAVARLTMPPHTKILVTTGLETLDPQARRQGLLSGANSVMLNVTPLAYRKLYEIYPQRAHQDDTIEKQIQEVKALLATLGRAPTDLSFGE